MSLRYQVNTDFTFIKGKLSLIGLSIKSTKSPCTTIPQYIGTSLLKTFRIFPTLKEAKDFILHIKKIYPGSKDIVPVINCGQKELF